MFDVVFESASPTSPPYDEAVCGSALKPAQLMERRALAALESHPHFRGRSQWVQIRYRDRCLYLSGKLPSFFLKQLAQEALRQLEGIDRLDNQIVVASPRGQIESSGQSVTRNDKPKRLGYGDRDELAMTKAR